MKGVDRFVHNVGAIFLKISYRDKDSILLNFSHSTSVFPCSIFILKNITNSV